MVSVARYRTISAVESVTENTACPEVLVTTPDAGAITDEPFSAVNVMVILGTGFPLWSSTATVIVDAVEPSAGTVVGLACTVD